MPRIPSLRALSLRAHAPSLSYYQQRRWLINLEILTKIDYLTKEDRLDLDEVITYYGAIMWERDDLYPTIRKKLRPFLEAIDFPLSTFRLNTPPVEYNPSTVLFSPDGKHIAVGTYHSPVQLLDVELGKVIREIPDNSLSMAFSPDGQYLLIASDENARLWNVTTGNMVRQFIGHGYSIFTIAVSPNGKFVLTNTCAGSDDATVRLWDIESGKELHQFLDHPNGIGMFSIAFSPDSEYVLTGHNTVARLYHRATGEYIRQFEGERNFTSVAFSPDGKFVVTSNHLITVLWNTDTGEPIRQFSKFPEVIDSTDFSSDGKSIFTVSSKGTGLWDIATGECIRSFHWPTDYITSACLSPDNKYVLTGANHGIIRLWKATT